ncbi:nucleoside ABC transporter membrane protein [Albimonas donghaensis]|uniref:Nucleoside ABC transporter membrane protein n=1 Tax=Albimonas donghaensis TaxID=356660 RepID=A0A1H2SNL2_9RHOB|nr:ABC transporter permease [Albimonas donghaensis]SDW33107.1 nucleoside ABC transporter membrane protein [Albimonas donghaensis]
MDMSALNPVAIAVALIVAATPLVFAAIGELVVEKAGVLNLGVEGMMIVGAIAGFAFTQETGSTTVGVLAALIAGALLAALFAFMTQVLMSNQVATGLALTLFGLGLAAMIGQPYSGIPAPPFPELAIPGLSTLPVIGPLLFAHDWLVYASLVLTAGVWWLLNRSRAGLILRAVGENHDAAHAIGYRVVAIRTAAILFGGACAGVGGAYLSMVAAPLWVEGMTAGRGWIALAIVVFASWKPWRAFLGAYIFGGVSIAQLNLQAMGVAIESQYLSMTPYLVTIVVLVIISADKARARMNAPACLGRPFFAAG